jgi:hypothetical protein
MMRTENEMPELINTAQSDNRIQAVLLNGSRANPNTSSFVFSCHLSLSQTVLINATTV